MTLYQYVDHREDLLDDVVEYIVGELDKDPRATTSVTDRDWQAYLSSVAWGVRRYARAHPHAFPLVTTPPPSAPWINPPLRSLRWIEAMLANLGQAGFTDEQVLFTYRSFNSFLLGHLLLEASAMVIDDPRPGDGSIRTTSTREKLAGTDVDAELVGVDAQAYPVIHRLREGVDQGPLRGRIRHWPTRPAGPHRRPPQLRPSRHDPGPLQLTSSMTNERLPCPVSAMPHPSPPAAATGAGDPHSLVQEGWGEQETVTIALLQRACQSPDPAVRRRLCSEAADHNLGMARRIARRYTGRGVEAEDLAQVAGLALVLAINRFDPWRGDPFSAYARLTIHGELKRHLRDHAWAVRPPRRLHDTYLQVARVTQDLTQSLGATPSTGDIANAMGIDADQVCAAQQAGNSYLAVSLQALTGDDHDTPTGDYLAMGGPPAVDTLLTSLVLQQTIHLLPPRDQLIVRLRFGQELTQRDIANHLGISQMHVSRLLHAILARLRTALTSDARELVPAGADRPQVATSSGNSLPAQTSYQRSNPGRDQ